MSIAASAKQREMRRRVMQPSASLAEEVSPLERDLLVARLRLTALKAFSASHPTEDDYLAARKLRETVLTELASMQTGAAIPIETVPQQNFRTELERTLASITDPRRDRAPQDERILRRLVDLLGELSPGQGFTQPMASELLTCLRVAAPRDEAVFVSDDDSSD